jgi:MFS transporter, YNFM family, putative membrane transport protein
MMAGTEIQATHLPASRGSTGALLRTFVIGLTAFLTVVDLFATQAILPSLAKAYGVSPAAIGFAVNASTIGMAIAGLAVAFFSNRIDRRRGILVSLILLSVPTALLAVAPDLTTFAWLRVAQGLCMSTAFALTLSYLAEHCSATDTAGAFAAYITGNVASNLFGRLMSAALVDHFGLSGNFYVFAALNLAGAVLVYFTLGRTRPMAAVEATARSPLSIWAEHLRNAPLRASFAIGFLILFAFIGTFTYVNFVLVREPLALSRMAVGFVYFVFLPSIFTTPLAGHAVQRFGTRPTFWGALALAGAGLPLLLLPHLPAVLAGLALIGVGTFFAQATATGFVGRAATTDRGSASGIYLASYFLGGIVGSVVLGQLFDRFGWAACVGGIGAALGLAALLAFRLKMPALPSPVAPAHSNS